MEDYLSIGQFANLSNTSIDTLRHYHKKGLLIPSYQNRDTGYRYYSNDQLSTIFIIKMLRDIGFSLEKIKSMLKLTSQEVIDFTLLKNNLIKHNESLEKEIHILKSKKDITSSVLNMIKVTEKESTDSIIREKFDSRYFLTSTTKLKYFSTKSYMNYYFQLADYSKSKKLKLQGPSSALVLNIENNLPKEILISHQVSDQPDDKSRIILLPKGEYVSLSFKGYQSPEIRSKYYSILFNWIKANGYIYTLPLIEFYPITTGFTNSKDSIQTKIQIKVEKL